jgi:hypothetical protein
LPVAFVFLSPSRVRSRAVVSLRCRARFSVTVSGFGFEVTTTLRGTGLRSCCSAGGTKIAVAAPNALAPALGSFLFGTGLRFAFSLSRAVSALSATG